MNDSTATEGNLDPFSWRRPQLAPLKRHWHRARSSVISTLSTRPSLYLPLARFKFRSSDGARPVTGETEIILEGYPRSANTFAVEAFRLAQGRPVEIAHHLHVAAQIIAGVRRGIPTVLLLRDPEQAASSLVVRLGWVDASDALRRYVRMHEALEPYRDGFLTAPFELVISNFGVVITQVNRRFGTDFRPFHHTPDQVRTCFRIIEENNRRKYGDGVVDEASVARPSNERRVLAESVRAQFQAPELKPLRDRARRIHQVLRG